MEGAARVPTSPMILAELLIDEGLKLNSRDNMSAIIVRLKAAPTAPEGAVAAWDARKLAAEAQAKAEGGAAGGASA